MFHNLIDEVWSATSGLQNLLLAGVDGIVVAHKHDDENNELIAAEAANLIKEAQRFGEEVQSGALNHLTTYYEDKVVVLHTVNEEYFLLGIVEDPKFLSQIRYRFTLKCNEWYPNIA